MRLDDFPVRKAEIISRVLDEETIIIVVETGMLHILNPIGTIIWELIDGKSKSKDIIRLMQERFSDDEVPKVAIEHDVIKFLNKLANQDLIDFSFSPTHSEGKGGLL